MSVLLTLLRTRAAMKARLQHLLATFEHSGLRLTAWIILAVAIGATGWGWQAALRHDHREDHDRFQLLVQRTQAAIIRRMDTCETIARSTAAFVDASRTVERDEWSRFVRGLNLTSNNSGIYGLGYIDLVPRKDREEFLRTTREDSAPDFSIYPEGDRPEYRIVKFIEPAERNE